MGRLRRGTVPPAVPAQVHICPVRGDERGTGGTVTFRTVRASIPVLLEHGQHVVNQTHREPGVRRFRAHAGEDLSAATIADLWFASQKTSSPAVFVRDAELSRLERSTQLVMRRAT